MPRIHGDKGSYRAMTPAEFEAAFWERIEPVTESGCWIWTGYTTKSGYAQMGNRYMHRYSFELHKGSLGDQHVCHTCDVPSCVNPHHLFLGSAHDNAHDKVRKGRARGGSMKGEAHNMHKLTQAQVDEIRAVYAAGGVSQWSLAHKYGVKQATISSIVLGKTWR